MKRIRRQVLLGAATLVVVVLAIEVSLRVAAALSPRVDWLLDEPWAGAVSDERLGHRPHPGAPGHDRNGFRNPRVPEKADIVVLGDSQTYGNGVAASEAWPRRLEGVLGDRTVYSMAFGGYGPAHSLLMMDDALALHPDVVIEALYAGNDLFDAFDLVYNGGRLPDLKTPGIEARVDSLEDEAPIAEHVGRMFHMGTDARSLTVQSSPVIRLLDRFKIFGLGRRLAYEIYVRARRDRNSWAAVRASAEAHPEFCQVFESDTLRTIFTSQYRLAALDLSDPRIAEGAEISLRAIAQLNEMARERRVQFVVLLIPTKELVFAEAWSDWTASYRLLVENETRFWNMTEDFLDAHGIPYIDALTALRGELRAGTQPYPMTLDGHPNPVGHEAISGAVAQFLR